LHDSHSYNYATSTSTTSTTTTTVLGADRRKNKKRVSIDGPALVRLTISRHDISPEEYRATWYSKEEYAEITKSCCKQIDMLNRGAILKDNKYCARGLETHTRSQSIAKRMNRSLAFQVVLDEQDDQIQQGISNEEALSRKYHAASSSCQVWANVVGLNDEREANNNYDHDSPRDNAFVLLR